jgi:hypothetical protein
MLKVMLQTCQLCFQSFVYNLIGIKLSNYQKCRFWNSIIQFYPATFLCLSKPESGILTAYVMDFFLSSMV